MSGKRQHFIPQFLQKGFASHTIGDEVFTWVYRKGVKPFNPNIKKVGVERYFYSENGDPFLDETISSAETDFSELIETMRNRNCVDRKQFDIVAELIAHFEVRTRHIRQNFLKSTNYLIDNMLDFLSNPNSCEQFLRKQITKDPKLLIEPISKELKKRNIPKDYIQVMMEQYDSIIEHIMPEMINSMPDFIVSLKAMIPKILKSATKQGHLKALNRGIAPEPNVNRLLRLNYRVENSRNNDLILGDSVVIFKIQDQQRYTPFIWKKDTINAVYLPISNNQVVVGSIACSKVDCSELRKKIAACSLEYFTASDCSHNNIKLQKFISDEAPLATTSQMEKMIKDYIEN